jgi:SpoIIAA-like
VLTITDDDAHNCLVLEPSGPLTRRDLDTLTERFDARVRATDRVPNLVIHAGSFPAWADFAALLKHLRFIREHHRLVERVAIVSDARALDLAPRLARRFVSAEVRHFPASDFEAALIWVGEAPAETSHVTVMEGLPDDVLGLSVAGVVSARDYAETIVPLIETKLAAHPKLRLLYRIGPEFEAYTPGAIWSDALVGVKHLTAFSRVAVVSDIGWIRHAVRLFAPLVPAEVHVFGDDEIAEAKAWVSA